MSVNCCTVSMIKNAKSNLGTVLNLLTIPFENKRLIYMSYIKICPCKMRRPLKRIYEEDCPTNTFNECL